jgi:hypothetical protein
MATANRTAPANGALITIAWRRAVFENQNERSVRAAE